jgi:hypothetical protein
MGRDDEIKLIAYNIWEQEGCRDGYDCEHWVRAEAIWEQQQKEKVIVDSTKTESKTIVKQKKEKKSIKI